MLRTLWALLALAGAAVASPNPEMAARADPALPIPYCAFVASQSSPQPTGGNGPEVEGIAPMSGHAGDVVTVTGHRLTGAVVIFREVPARTLTASDTMLTVQVPASTTGPLVIRTPDGQVHTDDSFVYVLKLEDEVLFPIPVGGGDWFPTTLFKKFEDLENVDAAAKFLQRHWTQPLPPQGKPPAAYSLVESTFTPQTCKMCHAPQFEAWKGSLHARSASLLVRWNARAQPTVEEQNSCRRCHDPEAENGPWTDVEMHRAPEDPKERPVRDGVQCVVCHVRSHQRFGPPPLIVTRPKSKNGKPPPPPPHNGFTAIQAYEDSRFCAGCHTFTIRVDKGMVGNPFEEWRTSPFAAQGVSCQKCHMPDRKHMFRGIHDREMTLSGLTISLELVEDGGLVTATATVKSTHVGHNFPTYPIPMVHVNLYRSIPGVTKKPEEAGLPIRDEYVIGRLVDLRPGHFAEDWDHRLKPGGALVMRGQFPPQPGEKVSLLIDVVPRDDYEKGLRTQVAIAEKDPEHAFLGTVRDLLAHEEGLRYRLVDLTLPVPAAGKTVQKTIREGVPE